MGKHLGLHIHFMLLIVHLWNQFWCCPLLNLFNRGGVVLRQCIKRCSRASHMSSLFLRLKEFPLTSTFPRMGKNEILFKFLMLVNLDECWNSGKSIRVDGDHMLPTRLSEESEAILDQLNLWGLHAFALKIPIIEWVIESNISKVHTFYVLILFTLSQS